MLQGVVLLPDVKHCFVLEGNANVRVHAIPLPVRPDEYVARVREDEEIK